MQQASAPARARPSVSGWSPTIGRHLGFAVLFFGAWELYGRLGNPLILPPFSAVAVAFWDMLTDGSLLAALAGSLRLLAIGFMLTLLVGLPLGIFIGRYSLADRTLSPYITALYVLPTVALVPLILVWFGFGLGGRVIVVFLAGVFPLLLNVYAGVRQAPEDLIEVARSFGASERTILWSVVLPSAVPLIMTGIRLGMGRAVVGMAVAEVYLRLGGIGALIVGYGSVFRSDYLIASILVLPMLGVGLSVLIGYIERRVAAWKVA